jgi:hypothetical protein
MKGNKKTRKAIITTIITIFLISLVCSLLVQSVKATSYEWIKNGSFETTTTDYILHVDSFQNDVSGMPYSGMLEVAGVSPYLDSYEEVPANYVYNKVVASQGSFSVGFENSTSLVTSINSSVLLRYKIDVGFHAKVYANINSTYYEICVLNSTTSWENIIIDISSFVTSFETINNFTLGIAYDTSTPTGMWFDYAELRIESGSSTANWFAISPLEFGAVGFTGSEHNTGSRSAFIVYKSASNYFNILGQLINYLSTDNLTSVSLYSKTTSLNNVSIQCRFFFSDETMTFFTNYGHEFNSTSGWNSINFLFSPYVPAGKLITSIQLIITNADEDSFIYFDDVSMLSTTQDTGIPRFLWYLIPAPYDYGSDIISNDFTGYTGQDYLFCGTFYNSTGGLSDTGIFTATSPLDFSTSGSVTNGVFSFTIPARPYSYYLALQNETFTITLTLPSGIWKFYIYAFWGMQINQPYSSPPPFIPEEKSGNLMDWVVMFCIIFLPAILFAGGIYENNKQQDAIYISPVYGLIAGLVLSVGIGVYTTFIPIWILILMIIAVAIIFVGMVKH